ncbi:transmembrane protein, putative (macronuclear) [Tetrahymena thermophila SB210]|uniref:Transmembrane protein, putative n=1 Tax=Tetrahymena thermophila (strain SB210) TaxID=312017 RepID=Q22TK2_TETTS|nr:transmembrane protein, putative [Tetrahymena thermophila SB210]EAR88436.2 transmembrane protein, putative [Tetrahymena thermophila SB210]|eukprot:XP_001008681.2 transmembrane protein, putative [Tetrahymena thermophila SB210]
MQVFPILTHQTSNFSTELTQDTLENPSKVNSAGTVTNFQAFQTSTISKNVSNPVSQREEDLSSQKNMNQLIADGTQTENQENNNQQEITDCRQSLNSDVTAHTCWFCKELPNAEDPFLCNCKCQGSNLIHASCMMKIADNEIKKSQKKYSKKSKKELVTEHICSICKYKFKSITKYAFHFDFSVTTDNVLIFLLGLISLSCSIGLIIISYKVFIVNNSEGESFSEICLGLIIFLIVLCISLVLSFILLAIYMFYKAFYKVITKQLELISDIKDKLIIYSYDQVKQSYFYDQTLNLGLTQKENKAIPQTLSTYQNSPLHKNDNQFFNIQEQHL